MSNNNQETYQTAVLRRVANMSRETLRKVTQNDPSLSTFSLADSCYVFGEGVFYSDNDDYSTLGAAIANNTNAHLTTLRVTLSDGLPLGVADREFYDGLKANSSINNLSLCRSIVSNTPQTIAGVGQEILKAYQEKNSHLIFLNIIEADLQNGGDRVIVDTLRSCRNLQKVTLNDCNITDAQLLPIAEAIREHGINILETLHLGDNNVGNAGCEAIATLLTDPNCNLHYLNLGFNAIDNEGATTIANSLANNTNLEHLYLAGNQIDQIVQDVFSNVLCNVSNINSLYASNHTLEKLVFGHMSGQQLESLLKLNKDTNKSHVAMKKILQNHSNIDVESLFEWGLEEDDEERTLKALPYVIDWFDRTRVAVADDGKEYGIEERKLSTIFQFAKAMPLLLEGISCIKVDQKWKRSE